MILLGSILVFGSSTWHRDTSVGNQSVYDGVYKCTICLGICGLLCIDPSPIWPTLNHGPYRNRFLAKLAFEVTSPSVSLWLIWCLDSFRSKPGMHWTTQVWYQFWWNRSFYSIQLSCFRNGLREVVGIQDISAILLYEKVKSCRLSVDHHWEMIRDGERLALAKALSNTDEMKTSCDLWRYLKIIQPCQTVWSSVIRHPSLPQFPRLTQISFPVDAIPVKLPREKRVEETTWEKKNDTWSLTASKEAKVWRISPTTLHQSAKFACLGWWVPTSFLRKLGNPQFRWMRFRGSYQPYRVEISINFFSSVAPVEESELIEDEKSGSLAKGFRILGNVRCLGRL